MSISKHIVIVVTFLFLLAFAVDATLQPKRFLRGDDIQITERRLPLAEGKKSGSKSKSKSDEVKSGVKSDVKSDVKKSGVRSDVKSGGAKSGSKKATRVEVVGLAAKKAKKTKGGGTMTAAELELILGRAEAEVLPVPVKLGPDINDWIVGCGDSSNAIDDCIVALSVQSNAANCKTCLYSMGSSKNAPPAVPIPNGVKVCASNGRNGMCGLCTKGNILPFYECGLRVEAAFDSNSATTTDRLDNSVDVIVVPVPPFADALVTPPIDPISVVEDTTNCPALWPGTDTDCVMVGGFDRKKCVYYEYSADSICTCSSPQHIWLCEDGPDEGLVTTYAGLPGSSSGSSAAIQETGNGSNPILPLMGMYAEISSLP